MGKILIFVITGFLFTTELYSTDYVFNGAVDTDWSNPANWAPSYPGLTIGANDNVIIQADCKLNNGLTVTFEDLSFLNIEPDINFIIETLDSLVIYGSINNFGILVNNGYLENEAGSTSGPFYTGRINNYGIINNFEEYYNGGILLNSISSEINNYNLLSSQALTNLGSINNYGIFSHSSYLICVCGSFNNEGTFNNEPESSFYIGVGNDFYNSGIINILSNSSFIIESGISDVNDGTIIIDDLGTLETSDKLTNNGELMINGTSAFYNELSNNSEISGNGELKQYDSSFITNNSTAFYNPGIMNGVGTLFVNGDNNPGDLDMGESTYNCEINALNETADLISVLGNVTLSNAKLNIDWLNVPTETSSYVIMTFNSRLGLFDEVVIPDVPGFTFDVNYSDTDISIIVTSTTLNLNDKSISNAFEIYPNPATKTIQFSNNTEVKKYKLYDLKGKMIQEGLVGEYEVINIQELSTGLYFIVLDDNYSFKFIKN